MALERFAVKPGRDASMIAKRLRLIHHHERIVVRLLLQIRLRTAELNVVGQLLVGNAIPVAGSADRRNRAQVPSRKLAGQSKSPLAAILD